MYGIDISHWQSKVDFNKLKDFDFLIHKCSQGNGYVDPEFKERKRKALEKGLIFGSYHFADGKDAREEARHYINSVGKLNNGELLVLDYEINLRNPDQWCFNFLDEVEKLTDIKPLLYTNEARVKKMKWKKVVAGNFGLWVAKWGVNDGKKHVKPASGNWPFWVLWQYTSRGKIDAIDGNVDLDYTYLDKETLEKYGYIEKEDEKVKDDKIDLTLLESASAMKLGGKEGRINQNEADDIAGLINRLKEERYELRMQNKDFKNQVDDLDKKLKKCKKKNEKKKNKTKPKNTENKVIKYLRLLFGIVKK